MSNKFNCPKILVLGAGSWGTTLSKILAYNVKNVLLHTRNINILKRINYHHINTQKLPGIRLPNNVKATNHYSGIQDIKSVVIAIPVKSLNNVFSNLGKLRKFENIILCSKGIDNSTLKFPSQICRQYFSNANIAVLSGPNFAKEVAIKRMTKTLIASTNRSFAKYLQQIFKTDYFYPEISSDVAGVEICGAIKNVIAIAIGIARGLDLGDNFIASLFVNAVEEIVKIVQLLGGRKKTVYSLAGLGDLLLTSYSLTSRNTSFGYNISQSYKSKGLDKMTIEGYYTAKSIFDIATKLGVKVPICNYVYQTLYNKTNLYKIIEL